MGDTSENKERKQLKKNICLGILAHVDAGKTTLSEGILYLTGTIRKLGRVDNRDAFLDTYAMERARGITIFSKQAVFSLGENQMTLLDTPGHVDFSAEMERTLHVLDYAILVISGADGVQGHTETLWSLLKRKQIPCFLFINKMDQPGTDRRLLMEELKSRLDGNCVDFGAEPEELWENLAMCDEQVLETYLEEGTVEEKDIRRLIAQRKTFPCYFGSALKLDGVEEFLKGLERYAPAPEYGEVFGAKVFKISRDDQGNRLTHLKITGGSLKVKALLQGQEGEKINQIRIYSGARYEAVPEAEPGMVCAVTGPLTTYPGQGIGRESESEQPILEPVLSYQVLLPEGCDPPVMLRRLRQLEEEEPQLHIVWNEVLQEIQVQVMGVVQIEVLKGLIHDRFGVDVEFGAGHIVYKETIARPVEGVGHFEPLRHYAEVHLLMEPAERGSGLQLETACSEDVLEKNWQRLVLTHLEEKVHKGVLTGSEITDMKITLIAGRAHLKHTEGGDFRQATYRAVRQGLREAGCRLLEPYYQFRLELPSEVIGRAMTDLERLQAVFEPPLMEGDSAVITGQAPVSAMWDYQTEVAAYTKGRGRLFCSLKGYDLCHNEEEVVAAAGYDPEADLENPTGSVFCAHGAGFVVPWDQVKDYMQVESPLIRSLELETGEQAMKPVTSQGTGQGTGQGSGKYAGQGRPFGADEKELEAIFTRTYGERKRKLPGDGGPRQVIYQGNGPTQGENSRQGGNNPGQGVPGKASEKPGYLRKHQETMEDYLLVDGYNIIYAWEELRELAKVTIDGARHRLMDILCNYQSFKKCILIVVFDAYKVEGNTGQALDYHNIHVVYTKEAETADQYIEKLAHQMGRRQRVTVATSDGLEQLIIHGQGCLLMSARELWEDVERIRQQIGEEQAKLPRPKKRTMFQDADEELAEYLEQVRLGKNQEKDQGKDEEKAQEKNQGKDQERDLRRNLGKDKAQVASQEAEKAKKRR